MQHSDRRCIARRVEIITYLFKVMTDLTIQVDPMQVSKHFLASHVYT